MCDNSKLTTIITCKVKAEVFMKRNYVHLILDLILVSIYRASTTGLLNCPHHILPLNPFLYPIFFLTYCHSPTPRTSSPPAFKKITSCSALPISSIDQTIL